MLGGVMTDDECTRSQILFDVKAHEFDCAMQRYGMSMEDAYYLTEIFLLWPDFGYNPEYRWLLQ
jgi:hypothetical protein